MKTLLFIAIFFSLSVSAQRRYPKDNYDSGVTSLGNLWFYVERLDLVIDSLQHELDMQRKLLQFNTNQSNYYIKKVDSFMSKRLSASSDTACDGFWGFFRHQLAWTGGGSIIGQVLDSVPDEYIKRWLGKSMCDSLFNAYEKY